MDDGWFCYGISCFQLNIVVFSTTQTHLMYCPRVWGTTVVKAEACTDDAKCHSDRRRTIHRQKKTTLVSSSFQIRQIKSTVFPGVIDLTTQLSQHASLAHNPWNWFIKICQILSHFYQACGQSTLYSQVWHSAKEASSQRVAGLLSLFFDLISLTVCSLGWHCKYDI